MFGKKKKEDEEFPDLNSFSRNAPSIRDYAPNQFGYQGSESKEIHGLPSFPDSPMQKGFSQAAIKDAIQTEEKDLEDSEFPSFTEEKIFPNVPRASNIIEMEEWKPSSAKAPAEKSMPFAPNKPIFIRLDKFKEAKESLDLIREKLNEMDSLLAMIKEVNSKENQELSMWEQETEKVKARINAITSGIFEDASQ